MSKNLHLLLSGFIVILAGLVYGGYPSYLMPLIFDFEANALELKNILRAVMGIYIGIGVFWLIGATKQDFWKAATLCNILFMGGIAFGRMVSTVFDGILSLFTPALILELLFFAWGLYNLKKYN
ncbi:DUF4345 domain-containing protein [Maribacter aestuarii]|uniref:DUF4345 domain-containing protein n=1 Tax=Maribacter aestuarii TaxID=1130723 RepID=UPI00248AA2DA|nr:DUF4345 domain-containing protein [Maribacter aestuarii]